MKDFEDVVREPLKTKMSFSLSLFLSSRERLNVLLVEGWSVVVRVPKERAGLWLSEERH